MRKSRNKPMVPAHRVMRVTWQPDYRDEAWVATWLNEEEHPRPTRITHPDAFYREECPAYPAIKAAATRQKPHLRLSRTQLRKRLSRAGLSGVELRTMVDRVMAGPTLADFAEKPVRGAFKLFMRWDTAQLKAVLGEHVARRVLRFVSTMFIVRDEFWDFADGLAPGMARFFEQARSFKPERVPASQDTKELENLACALIPGSLDE